MKSLIIAVVVAMPLIAAPQARIDDMKAGYDREMEALIDRYYHSGDWERVEKLLRSYSKQHPEDAEISNVLAWMLFNNGNEPASLIEGMRFVRDNPNSEAGKIQLAQQFFQRKLYSRVPPLLEPLVGKTKELNAYVMLGRSYEVLGLLKSALRVHEARMKLFPDDAQGKKNLEKLKEMLGGGSR
jgi:predicted Zn-dependent protease